MTQQELMTAIEPLIDKTSLSCVLLAIGRICNEKAEHLQVNWQDSLTARRWDSVAARIDKVAEWAGAVS